MNQLKQSVMAKITAWILITVSGVTLAASAAGAFAINELGYYTNSAEEIREQVFDVLSSRYCAWALNFLKAGGGEEYFSDKNFKYGIIEAADYEELSQLNLNDDAVYVERNFTDKVRLEDLKLFQCNVNEKTTFLLDDGLFGHCYVTNTTQSYMEKAITDYIYDTGSGIFYYKTADGYYYPVDKVGVFLCETNNSGFVAEQQYRYNVQSGKYDRVNDSVYAAEAYGAESTAALNAAESSEVWNPDDVSETGNVSGASVAKKEDTSAQLILYMMPGMQIADEEKEKVMYLLTEDTLTFQAFDDMPFFNAETWAACMIYPKENDETEEWPYAWVPDAYSLAQYGLVSENVELIQPVYSDLSEQASMIQNHTEYDSSKGGFLWTIASGEKPGTDYYVVSYVPDELVKKEDAGLWANDLYVQADYWLNLANRMKYSVYIIFAVNLILFAVSLAYLIAAAGHKKGETEIVPGIACKIPFDIFTAAAVLAELAVCVIFMVQADAVLDTGSVFYIVCAALVCIGGGWIALFYILNFAVRIKSGKWWENTIVYKIFCAAGHAAKRISENIPALQKGLLLFFGINAAEVFVFAIFGVNYGKIMVIWLLEKLAVLIFGTACLIQLKTLQEGSRHIAEGDASYKIETQKMYPVLKEYGDNLNRINEGIVKAVDEKMKSERFKTELITNVSHDIKTPLTSIINYVDLLEKEDIGNETAKEYLEVLKRQSARLKKLIEDLIEASKASTGNLSVNLEKLEAGVFMVQTVGEFEEKTMKNELELIIDKPETPIYIMADGRHFWRVIDNLMNNICKYAQPQTRVYITLAQTDEKVTITFRNTSRYPLNITSEELMERFVRGDSSRNTEGNGLGLSIAKSLMELMKGSLTLHIDGDLFKVILAFDRITV